MNVEHTYEVRYWQGETTRVSSDWRFSVFRDGAEVGSILVWNRSMRTARRKAMRLLRRLQRSDFR